ncbi:MAG: hypothetical protein QXX56_05415 [Candidatus Bathyarchaeia archaeon]
MLPAWKGSLLRLMSKVCDVERLPFSKFSLKDYVKMFTRKLRKNYTDASYVDAVEAYAAMLCDAIAGRKEIVGKNPACVAVSVICVADGHIGGRIGADRIVKILNVGFNQKIVRLVKKIIKDKRLLPPRFAWDKALDNALRKVLEMELYGVS